MDTENLVRSVLGSLKQEAKGPLGLFAGALGTLMVTTVGIPEEKITQWFGAKATFTADYVVLSAAALLCMCGVAISVRALRAGTRVDDPVAAPRDAKFECRVLDTLADAALINHHLVSRMFPDGSIDTDHALRAQEKNPCRLIGLIDRDSAEVAGWSSLWPVTVSAGEAIERGRRTDDDLKVDDLLPKSRNSSARYLVLLSFGILPEYRNARECPTRRLGRFAIGHIITNFLKTSDRSIRLVAVAYSAEGERMCKLLGLKPNGCNVTYPTGQRKPVFVGDATMESLIVRSQGF